MREPFPAELDDNTKAELAIALDYDQWADVPDVVQNNLRTPNVDLDGFLEQHRGDA
jgi:hypothetical protein